jgi:hypothetical protein
MGEVIGDEVPKTKYVCKECMTPCELYVDDDVDPDVKKMHYGVINTDGKTMWINTTEGCVARIPIPQGDGNISMPYFQPTGSFDHVPMFTEDQEINMPMLNEFATKFPRAEYCKEERLRAKYNNFLMAHLLEIIAASSDVYPEDVAIIFATYSFKTMNPCRSPELIADMYAFEPMCGQGTVEELPKDVKDVHKDY